MAAAAGEPAAGLRLCQVGNGTVHKPRFRRLQRSVYTRHRLQQGPAVGMARCGEEAVAVSLFDDLAHIHHGNLVTHMLHDTKIVADEQIGQANCA